MKLVSRHQNITRLVTYDFGRKCGRKNTDALYVNMTYFPHVSLFTVATSGTRKSVNSHYLAVNEGIAADVNKTVIKRVRH